MGSFNLFRQQNKIFWENFWKYSQIIILIQLLIAFIFVPILNFLTSWILKLGHVNYVSYNNLIFLMTKKPLVILGLLVILLFILVLVFSQFALLLVSFQAIKSNADLKWRDYFKNVFKQLYGLPFKAFGFFLLYFLLIIPFAGIGFSSNLLNKVKIPEFIIEWLFQEHLPFAILLMILYVIVLYIGLRLILFFH
jgi:Membrane domain of membrane-anchored glycerophosphoryl diester phosphodiesterase